ncbi:DUF4864 domain-containing protein [Marimonas sp. MJW-29]|uniref:DUF4864 domain-containing protein n=1 Tax=Sulfitobacter sediminis TaxID=3234186 RepID=A0ABV3RQI6_9RHOB
MWKSILNTLGGVALGLMLAVGAGAQQAEIEGTISSQIEAFKADDFEQAFTYASPRLQDLFQTPQNFQRIVTQGYPMVWRPADVQYLELLDHGGSLWQKVQIIDEKGVMHLLLYRMQETEEGWRIAGVQILEAPQPTV